MSRHAMRTRRQKAQRAAKHTVDWAAIIRPGGLLVGAPDTISKLDAAFVAAIERHGVTVRESPYMPPGTVYGIAPQPPLRERWVAYDI